MEDKSREVVMAISNAARYMDPFFKLTAMGTVLLIQYFARMVKEKKLKVTEFTDFQKFLKATDGKYDIMNVPGDSRRTVIRRIRCTGYPLYGITRSGKK
ncbi:hypothetical protein NIA73_14215 [Anaerobutyricum hallii]|nr:hypothetical protein [Anaerobutyricum hallii]